jgi:hypothetical protein
MTEALINILRTRATEYTKKATPLRGQGAVALAQRCEAVSRYLRYAADEVRELADRDVPADSCPEPDRKTLERVAKSYNDLMALQKAQRTTMAVMIRACVKQLKNPDSAKRAEAITALDQLADMLDKKD